MSLTEAYWTGVGAGIAVGVLLLIAVLDWLQERTER